MKITNSFNFVNFYNKVKDQTMPISTAYKLSKLYNSVSEDEKFYREKLRAILSSYAELDENGNFIFTEDGQNVKIKDELRSDCVKAIEDLQNIESTISFDPIPLSALESLSVTPADIEGIMCFLE